MQFDEALNYLLSLGHETLAVKLGLANTERLLEALGRPQDSFQSVQIAGTNGKGSTAAMLESVCLAARIKTGLYTSPHLVSITERIRVGGREISEEDFARLTTQVREAAERLLAERQLETLPTFFEHVTAVALLAFREAGVRLAILETGLGGRLDATTVARAGTVAITPVAIDHQEYLGDTLEEIAAEKAAIIRPGSSAVIAPQPPGALEVILRRCADCGVTPRACEHEILGAEDLGRVRATFRAADGVYENILLGLRGRHQATNACTVVSLAEALRERGFDIPREAVRKGLETSRHPGRLELIAGRPQLLLDGAHNAAGARALRDFLDEFVRAPVTLLFGAMRDKDLGSIASTLFPAARLIVLTEPTNPRAASVDALRKFVPDSFDSNRLRLIPSPSEALQAALDLTPPDGLICVTGSLYLIGEISFQLSVLSFQKRADAPSEN